MMPQRPLDSLTQHAYPELAEAVRTRAERMLERWEGVVRELLPSADELTLTQLRDSLPLFLGRLADALAGTGAGRVGPVLAVSSEHGEKRFHQDYNLGEILTEYGVLRRMAAEEAAAGLGRDLTADESLALHAGIDAGVGEAVLSFSEHQREQLKAATEQQSKYLSFLSHDLRGGLNGIFLMIEVLKRELAAHPPFAETVQDMDMMRRSILETVATMDRFLHAEKFRKGKVQVNPGPVDLSSLLGEIGAQFSYQARDKGVELKVDVPRAGRITSDRELLSLIFQNLLSNAVKYTPKKGAVRVGAAPTADGGVWQVEVVDGGPGIPPDKLAELFDDFTRGNTHGQPGVGLGLSIARQAADLLGARLWAEAAPGGGAAFFVRVPEIKPQGT